MAKTSDPTVSVVPIHMGGQEDGRVVDGVLDLGGTEVGSESPHRRHEP